MTLEPPGVPPGGSSRGRSKGDWTEGSTRLLKMLAQEGGRVERKKLYRWSGLSPSQFADWLAIMADQEIIEIVEDFVVLRHG